METKRGNVALAQFFFFFLRSQPSHQKQKKTMFNSLTLNPLSVSVQTVVGCFALLNAFWRWIGDEWMLCLSGAVSSESMQPFVSLRHGVAVTQISSSVTEPPKLPVPMWPWLWYGPRLNSEREIPFKMQRINDGEVLFLICRERSCSMCCFNQMKMKSFVSNQLIIFL